MNTSQRVHRLGLYASECCMNEVLFDRNDHFSRCPRCERLCSWDLVEEVVSWQDLEEPETLAA
jgi:hypothetical protein